MIDEIKNSKKADGCDKIYYPGEIEMEKLAKCKEVGYVEILDETMESVERIEKELGLR